LFEAAGWYPGRSVPVPPSVPDDHPARAVLAEFGNLTVGHCGPGEECATSDIVFKAVDSSDADIVAWANLLRTHLIGIAEVCHSHGELFMDEHGRCFHRSCVHDAFWLEGSFAEAVERLLLGRQGGHPMLRPGQGSG
jgi:hypothetical protein